MTLLVLAVLGTGVWALSGTGAAVSIHLLVDAVAVFYGALLYESKRRLKEQRRKVRSIARHPLSTPRTPWPDREEQVAL